VTDLDALRERVGKGLTWLVENGSNAFYFRYEARLTPTDPPPKEWDAAKIEAYRRWYHARRLWEELNSDLERREREGSK
jgi:hypothetical protein